MQLGRIFKDITGRKPSEFKTTSEIWEAVKLVKPTKVFNETRYGNDVVKCTGSIFELQPYHFDTDTMIKNLG